MSLVLSILAALGFDGLSTWRRPGRGVVGFVVAGLVLPALCVLAVELGLMSAGNPRWAGVADAYRATFRALPWHDPEAFNQAARAARISNLDPRVDTELARQRVTLATAPRPVFEQRRLAIYRQELTGSTIVLFVLLGLAPLAKWRIGAFRVGLFVLTALDLGTFGRHRRVDLGPIAPFASQSPIIGRLAKGPHGLRTIDPMRNLPMVPGAAPVSAYRTLDLPVLDSSPGHRTVGLSSLAARTPSEDLSRETINRAFRATGAGLRIFSPQELRELRRIDPDFAAGVESVHDPVLAGWLYGTDWVAQKDTAASTFGLWRPAETSPRGWLVPLTGATESTILGEWSGDPRDVLNALETARPIEVHASDPEHRELSVDTEQPSLVVLSELADPQWQPVWSDTSGESRPAIVERAFGLPNQGAWQAVRVPGPGRWTLRLEYNARDVYEGLFMSGVAVAVTAFLAIRYGRARPVERSGES
jgi:hypothetical protein